MLSLSQHLPAATHADVYRSCFINYDDDEFYGACFMAGMSMPEISVPSSGRNKLPQTYFLKKVVNWLINWSIIIIIIVIIEFFSSVGLKIMS